MCWCGYQKKERTKNESLIKGGQKKAVVPKKKEKASKLILERPF